MPVAGDTLACHSREFSDVAHLLLLCSDTNIDSSSPSHLQSAMRVLERSVRMDVLRPFLIFFALGIRSFMISGRNAIFAVAGDTLVCHT